MKTRYFALVYGIVFAVVGIAGFIGGLVTSPHPDDPALAVNAGHGRLFGLFPINILHNLFHLAFGAWAIAAYRTFPAARTYARSVAVVYGVLTIMGLIPLLNTTFGLIPIHSHDVWLHLVLAAVAAYFGFAEVDRAERTVARPEAR